MFSEFDPQRPEASFAAAKIEVERLLQHLANLPAVEAKEALEILSAEIDRDNGIAGAQERLEGLIQGRSERVLQAQIEAEKATELDPEDTPKEETPESPSYHEDRARPTDEPDV